MDPQEDISLRGTNIHFENEHEDFVIPKFRVREFWQQGISNIVLDPVALMCLNNFRQNYGRQIRVMSGFRTIEHNKTVGGVSNSLHLTGSAFDLYLPHWSYNSTISHLLLAGFNEVISIDGTDMYHAGLQHGK